MYFDVVVVGAGIAGLCSAISAAEEGLSVAVMTKEQDPIESNTRYAQGGIVESSPEDSPELLIKDILHAGSSYNSLEAVKLVAKEGPSYVNEYLVNKAAVPFVKKANSDDFDRTKEAAHSVRRILHYKDKSGEAIATNLHRYVGTHSNITLLSNHVALEIISNSHNSKDPQERYRKTRAIGVYVLNAETEVIEPFFCSSLILATGGVGNLFLHTSNPVGASGDGIAMAYRAGAAIINAEFVQFHPTVLFHRDVQRFLISEALRGEGGRLRNRQGQFFMERYNSELRDLAPRDEVARAIYREIEADGAGYVFLDTSDMKDIDLANRFPSIYQKCKDVGIDIQKEAIPVVPAAHYFCGGIKINLKGRTTLPGLYAVGECSCSGVHGANRLASVSLLEALVFAVKAGKDAAAKFRPPSKRLMQSIPSWVYPSAQEDFDSLLIQQDMRTLQSTMWNYVGIIRSQKRLDRALSDINYLSHRIERFYKQAKLNRQIIELRNAVLTATIIARAAAGNSKSLGCHFVE